MDTHIVPIDDPALLAFLKHRIERTTEQFRLEPSQCNRQVLLLFRPDGPPENVQIGDGASVIFLKHYRDDWHRARYQLAHEVVHLVLSVRPEPVFSWVQEMFAVHVAVRAMHELGEHKYATSNEAGLWEKARLLARREMLAATLRHGEYPDGLYGQAFVTGLALIDRIGWERLKLLGTQLDDYGQHDIAAWSESLEPREHLAVQEVLEGE